MSVSYNIDSSDYADGTGPLYITSANVEVFKAEAGDNLAEGNVLDSLTDAPDRPGYLEVTRPDWYGTWSGRSRDMFIRFLELTEGSADIILCWEGGDSYTGLRVRNGKVSACKVKQTLEEESAA